MSPKQAHTPTTVPMKKETCIHKFRSHETEPEPCALEELQEDYHNALDETLDNIKTFQTYIDLHKEAKFDAAPRTERKNFVSASRLLMLSHDILFYLSKEGCNAAAKKDFFSAAFVARMKHLSLPTYDALRTRIAEK